MLTSGAAKTKERSTTYNSFFFSKVLCFYRTNGYRHGKQIFEDDSRVTKFDELKRESFFDRAKKRCH